MALALYSEANEDSAYSSSDSDEYIPIIFTFDGTKGGSITKNIFLRNDNVDRYYSEIWIEVVDTGLHDHTNGTIEKAWNWKMMIKDLEPDEEEWVTVSPCNYILFSEDLGSSTIGDVATYWNFWIRVEIPPYQLAQTIKTISLRVRAHEKLVL